VGGLNFRAIFFGPSGPRAIWRLAFFVALLEALFAAERFGFKIALPHLGGAARALLGEVAQFAAVLLASGVMARLERRSIAAYGLPWRRALRGQFWLGALIGLLMISALVGALALFGGLRVEGLALRVPDIALWAGIYGLVFLLVALLEEFRDRGYGLYALSQPIGFWPAAVVSSAWFGFGHIGNGGEAWAGLVNAALVGLVFCLLLRRTGDLWMAIGAHTGFNWGETYLFGAANSGQRLPGALLNTAPAGPAWLSGGSVGPEGSVLFTLVVAATFLLCWLGFASILNPETARDGLESRIAPR